MKTTNILLLGATLVAAGLVGCGDDSSGTGGGGGGDTTTATGTTTGTTTTTTGPTTSSTTTGSTSTGTGGAGGSGGAGGGTGFPEVPELGTQLERMGRPAINTALVDTFAYLTGDKSLIGPSTSAIRSASEDAYNAASYGSDEAGAFVSTHALQLTVLDSLDGVCGNQPLYGFGEDTCFDDAGDPDLVNGAPLACYGTLATVLNLDAMWLKTTYDSCGLYLGVEADGAAGLGSADLPANEDCGGRRPVDDVIRNTYSVVSGVLDDGNGNFTFGFDDLIDPPADLHPDTFPYLAQPNQ